MTEQQKCPTCGAKPGEMCVSRESDGVPAGLLLRDRHQMLCDICELEPSAESHQADNQFGVFHDFRSSGAGR